MSGNLEEKLKELKKEYLIKLHGSLLNLKKILVSESIDITEVYSEIHKIAGTSGLYGINNLSDLSTEFELYLKPLKENQDPVNLEELKNKFSNYISRIEKIILVGE